MEHNDKSNTNSKKSHQKDRHTAAITPLLSTAAVSVHPSKRSAPAAAPARNKNNKRTAVAGRQKCLTIGLLIAIMMASLVQIVIHYHHLAPFSDTMTMTGIEDSNRNRMNNNNKQGSLLLLDLAAWKLKATAKDTLTDATTPATETMSLMVIPDKNKSPNNSEQPRQKRGSNSTRTTTSASDQLQAQQPEQQKNHPLLKLLQDANILPSDINTMNETTITSTSTSTTTDQELHIGGGSNHITLPSWSTLQSLYGDLDQPVIIGLETCAAYRQQVPVVEQRYTAVAGMFNTGTNAMEFHLRTNIPAVRHTWQVPWGKHRMPFVRLSHVAPGMAKENQQQVLPVVMIRDPFHWMQSMCRTPYAAHWPHMKKHCPNLVPTAQDYKRLGGNESFPNGTVPVKVIFSKEQIFYWESLIHLYNDYYQQYLHNTPPYPRLIVRFEDMLLMPQCVVKHIAECVGVEPTDHFAYQTNSAKGHGSHTTMLKAILKTADAARRIQGMTKDDIQFAQKHMDAELIKVFRYHMPTSK